ncbi:hypothetical protein LX92_04286 [Maribacter polysiphoniae]|uniref:Uncharacterized protein n=1 Tax=Maribacter polysiphoniae TaxID=429344 RepID=A0A316DL65_9FLAO|nr:hypothetical protein LX92_04286 [Maribacter polysiphoniae]
MSYKIKSLIYFSCFLAATLTYYAIDTENQNPDVNVNEDFAELQQTEAVSLDLNNTLK